MMFEHNPFHHPGPVRLPEDFYNRQAEVSRALYLLKEAQSISIIGPRKIGKTSLLFHIANSRVIERHGLSANRYLLVYIDCEGLHDLTKDEFYKYILDEIRDKLEEEEIDLNLSFDNSRTSYLNFERSIKAVTKERRLALIFDEFEHLSTNPHLDITFFSGLRALSIKHEVTFITASKLSLTQIPNSEPNSLLSSHFFNIFSTIRLQLFSVEDGQKFIEEALAGIELIFSTETIDWMLRVSGCHPFFLQLAGDCTYEQQVARYGTGQAVDYTDLEQCINEDAVGHFRYYWDDLSPEEQYVLTALPWLKDDPNFEEILVRLEEKCLIIKYATGYDHFSPLFGNFVAQQSVKGILRSGQLLIDRQRRTVFLRNATLDLTELNYQLLVYLVEREGQTVSSEELDRGVWQPTDPSGGEERVKKAINALRQKLGQDGDCIANHRGRGYTFLPPAQGNHQAGYSQRLNAGADE